MKIDSTIIVCMVDQASGVGIVSVARDHRQSIKRNSAYYLYDSSEDRALILGTALALESIGKDFKKSEITLNYKNIRILELLSAERASKYIYELGKLKTLLSSFDNVSVNAGATEDIISECNALAAIAITKKSFLHDINL